MLYYSEDLKRLFESEDDLLKAEQEHHNEVLTRQVKRDALKKEVEQKKKAMEEAAYRYNAATKEYHEAVGKYNKEMTSNSDSLSRFFNYLFD